LLAACGPKAVPPPAEPPTPAAVPPAVQDVAEASADPVNAAPTTRNDRFLAEDLNVDEWMERFERAEREVYAYHQPIVDTLGIATGMTVADIGAGTGAYIEPLATAVGTEGTVYAVELSPVFVAHLTERASDAGLTQVQVVQSTAAASHLPEDAVDLAILVDVYHHLDDDEAFLADVARALKPGGRLALVEFHRIPGVSSEWILGHVELSREEVVERLIGMGWTEPTDIPIDGLVDNYVLTLTVP